MLTVSRKHFITNVRTPQTLLYYLLLASNQRYHIHLVPEHKYCENMTNTNKKWCDGCTTCPHSLHSPNLISVSLLLGTAHTYQTYAIQSVYYGE